MDRVKGKIAIVTGAAAGIGRACAVLLAREGASVVLTDVDESGGASAAEEITGAGGRAIFVRQDVSVEADWKRVVERAREAFGRVDVLVNNAGIYVFGDLVKTTVEEMERVFRVNVLGPFLGMKYCAPLMEAQGRGSIINLSSIAGMIGMARHTVYGASKGAIRTMTKDVAMEYARRGVRVNSIHPGAILTQMVEMAARDRGVTPKEFGESLPTGAMGEPMDVAWAVVYLASDESKFVTGSELVIDGAYTAQ